MGINQIFKTLIITHNNNKLFNQIGKINSKLIINCNIKKSNIRNNNIRNNNIRNNNIRNNNIRNLMIIFI